MSPKKSTLLKAVEELSYGMEKIEEIDPGELELDEKILDNRLIALQGYLRYLDQEGVDLLKKIQEELKEVDYGR